MNLKKGIAFGLVSVLSVSMLTGCGDQSEIKNLKSLQSLNAESTVTNYKLTYSESQSLVYAQVSDRTLLDLSQLEACSDNELQAIQNYMNNVDNQLIGSTSAKDGVIDDCFTDYLLAEFEQTPYYWQRSQMTVRGKDAESGAIIADVTYKTIDFEKEVIPTSSIALGCENYEQLMQVRFQRWSNIMSKKYGGGSGDFTSEYNKFVQAYGEPAEIIAAQSRDCLSDYIYQTGKQITYTGMTDSTEEKSGGTMTVRYVIVPNYVLGVNLGLTCEHMYIIDYKLDKDPTEGLSLFTQEGYQTVTDAVYEMLYSYFQCTDENDYHGLCSLTQDFGTVDKYWKDLFNCSYRKHNNFTLSVFDITGTHITCGAVVSTKIRAKGSNMTMPLYTDRYYFEIELVDGKLQVTNMVLLSRNLEGEPAITTDEADTSGFVASVDLNNEDKVAIEKLICDFSHLQLMNDTTSDNFGEVVDLSMSSANLSSLKEHMTSMSGAKKVVWLLNYMEGTSNFASVKCKELFQAENNEIVEASIVYQFIQRGGRWYVYGYDITTQTRLDTTNLATTGNLCIINPEGTVSYTSQVTNTNSSVDLDNLTDVSKVYEYAAYTPTIKSGVTEQGKKKMTVDSLSQNDVDTCINNMSKISNAVTGYEPVVINFKNSMDSYLTSETGSYLFYDAVCIYYNISNNLYLDENEQRQAVENWSERCTAAYTLWESTGTTETQKENVASMKALLNSIRRCIGG